MFPTLDELVIPKFLDRRVFDENGKVVRLPFSEEVLAIIAEKTGKGTRTWAPIKSVEECRRKEQRKTLPVFPSDPSLPVHVVMGEPPHANRIAEHADFPTFQANHDQEDYPVRKLLTAGGVTYIQVIDRSGEGMVAVRAPGTVPRKAGLRDVIWKRADELWAAAGKPKDASTVLKLRKEWMNILEKEGVKRTTCSSEFGNWQKDRLA